jgi:hypothetical protein
MDGGSEESAKTDKYECARDLLRQREGDIARGVAVSSQIGRLRFEAAAKDIESEYVVNGRRSLGELKRQIKLHLTAFFEKLRELGAGTKAETNSGRGRIERFSRSS